MPNFFEKYFRALFRSVLVAAAFLYAVLYAYYKTGVFNDDAVYILGARSLWKAGPIQSYILRPDYPLPGLPVLYFPFIKLFEPNWVRLEWVAIGVALLSVYLLGLWVRRFLTAGETLAVMILYAFNPQIAKFASTLMPSIPYVTATLGCLILLGLVWERENRYQTLALGFVMGWACFMRPEGAVLTLSIVTVLMTSRKGWRLLGWIAIPLVGWGLFLIFWWHKIQAQQTAYGSDLSALAAYWKEDFLMGSRFSVHLLQTFFLDAVTGMRSTGARLGPIFAVAFFTLSVSAAVRGYIRLWHDHPKRRMVWSALALFCVSYFAIHAFWHVAIPRYAIPLMPFLMLALVSGFSRPLSASHARRVFTGIALVAILGVYAWRNGRAIHQAYFAPDPRKGPPWHTLEWIKTHTPPDAKIITGIGSTVELYTERTAIPGMRSTNSEMFLFQIHENGADYILDRDVKFLAQGVEGTDNPNRDWERFRFRFAAYPHYFRKIFEDEREQTRVYDVTMPEVFYQAYETMRKAHAHYQAGELQAAQRLASKSISLYPRLALAKNLLGVIAWRQNQFDLARTLFMESIEIMPTSSNAMLNLGSLYQQMGMPQESEVYIQKALALSQAKGEYSSMNQKLKELYAAWNARSALIFIDIP